MAQPGAITRAHRGILFMDEAPEFSARTLQTLREPLESGYVAISRAKGTTYYPARFQLIGGESLPVRLRVRQRRALHLPRKGPRQVFQPAFRTDPRPYRHPDRGASGGADKSGERSLRRFEPCHTSACHRCPADGAGTVPRIRLVLQRAGYRHLAESQHLPQGHRIGQPRLASERLSLRGADRAMRLAWTLSDLAGKTSPGPEEMMQGISMRTRLA